MRAYSFESWKMSEFSCKFQFSFFQPSKPSSTQIFTFQMWLIDDDGDDTSINTNCKSLIHSNKQLLLRRQGVEIDWKIKMFEKLAGIQNGLIDGAIFEWKEIFDQNLAEK